MSLFGRIMRPTTQRLIEAIRPPEPVEDDESSSEELEHIRELHILDLAMRTSELLLSTGASANDATVSLLRITRAYGLRRVHADVTFTTITVTHYRGPDTEPLTTSRVVTARSTDYVRLQRVYDLMRLIDEGDLDVDPALSKLNSIVLARRPYRPWVITAATAGLAVGLCTLFDSSWVIIVCTAISSVLIDRTVSYLGRKGLPPFFSNGVGAAIPTVIALLVGWGQASGIPILQGIRPHLVVATGIVILLAGMSVVGAAQDSLDGFHVTASGRMFEVVVLTLGIITGILAVLHLGNVLGITLKLSIIMPGLGPLPIQILGALLIGASFSVMSYSGLRTVFWCALMSGLGWLGYYLGTTIGFGNVAASGIGALIAAMVSSPIASRFRVPALALTTSGIVPMMPGGIVYRGLLQTVQADTHADAITGILVLGGAAGVGIALAAGTSLGTYLTRPVTQRLWRTGKRVTPAN